MEKWLNSSNIIPAILVRKAFRTSIDFGKKMRLWNVIFCKSSPRKAWFGCQ